MQCPMENHSHCNHEESQMYLCRICYKMGDSARQCIQCGRHLCDPCLWQQALRNEFDGVYDCPYCRVTCDVPSDVDPEEDLFSFDTARDLTLDFQTISSSGAMEQDTEEDIWHTLDPILFGQFVPIEPMDISDTSSEPWIQM